MEKGGNEASLFWVADSTEQLSDPLKVKRRVRPKKIEFDGWGSKPLIEFLESIGKETDKQLSQYDVTAIVNEYINKNNLLHPGKKKRVLCDEWLSFLFGRKSIARNKIYDLLEAHFAENHDESEDELLYNSEEKEENDMTTSRKRKASSSEKKVPCHTKEVPETPKSCFAAIISENIKLVYLRRSLVQELLKDPESFEGKVVGSYVRIKSDPNDYSQKNSHQILQVTGVRKASECDVSAEIFLQVPNLIKEIRICTLSDDNFSKEECDDLHQRVTASSVKRPTVVELELKAQILHEDITKHWLVRELALLQNLIDQANEKGWRRELFDYLERKQLLQKPSEQSRLLLEVPKIIAEELEPEATLQDPVEEVKQGNCCSQKSIVRGTSADISFDTDENKTLPNLNFCGTDAAGSGDAAIASQVTLCSSFVGGDNTTYFNVTLSTKGADEDQPDTSVQQQKQPSVAMSIDSGGEIWHAVNIGEKTGSQGNAEKVTEPQVIEFGEIQQYANAGEKTGSRGNAEKATKPQVIDLSDDDEEDENPGGGYQIVDNPQSMLWYYMDPQGGTQGPFSMTLLKRWSDADYFSPGFMVWKTGQNAVLLQDMLCRMFPN